MIQHKCVMDTAGLSCQYHRRHYFIINLTHGSLKFGCFKSHRRCDQKGSRKEREREPSICRGPVSIKEESMVQSHISATARLFDDQAVKARLAQFCQTLSHFCSIP